MPEQDRPIDALRDILARRAAHEKGGPEAARSNALNDIKRRG